MSLVARCVDRKLQLAGFQWTIFKDEAVFEQRMDLLVESMRAAMSGSGHADDATRKITESQCHRVATFSVSVLQCIIFPVKLHSYTV